MPIRLYLCLSFYLPLPICSLFMSLSLFVLCLCLCLYLFSVYVFVSVDLFSVYVFVSVYLFSVYVFVSICPLFMSLFSVIWWWRYLNGKMKETKADHFELMQVRLISYLLTTLLTTYWLTNNHLYSPTHLNGPHHSSTALTELWCWAPNGWIK